MSTVQPQEIVSEVKQRATRAWWILLIQGIVMLVLGLTLFGQPGKTLIVLTRLLGTFWLISGILDIVAGLLGRTENSRIWTILAGVITAAAGLVVLNHTLFAGALTASVLTFMIGFAILVNGVLQIFMGRASADGMGREWSLGSLVIGILYVIGGIFLLGHQGLTAAVLLNFIAAWALITGIAQIVFAFRIRGKVKEVKASI